MSLETHTPTPADLVLAADILNAVAVAADHGEVVSYPLTADEIAAMKAIRDFLRLLGPQLSQLMGG